MVKLLACMAANRSVFRTAPFKNQIMRRSFVCGFMLAGYVKGNIAFFMSASSPSLPHPRPATIIPDEAVSIAALDELFKRAFYKTMIDDEGDLYITAGLEFPIWVRVDAERKLIRFFTFMHRDLNEHPPFTEALANHLNATVILPSFYVVASEPDKLYATYHAS